MGQRRETPHRPRPRPPFGPEPVPELGEHFVDVVSGPQHHAVGDIAHPHPQDFAQAQFTPSEGGRGGREGRGGRG